MHTDQKGETALSVALAPRRGRQVALRLRLCHCAPSAQAEAAWVDFLVRMLRKRAQQVSARG